MTEVKADYSTNYWETVAKQERQKAEANLRLAAERATTIQELSDELRAAKAMNSRLKGAIEFVLFNLDKDHPEDVPAVRAELKKALKAVSNGR